MPVTGSITLESGTSSEALGFDFTMAFQPIVDLATGKVFAHEALARGLHNEGAAYVFQFVNEGNLYRFDQTCRNKAIELAATLGVECALSINFLPNAIHHPETCIRATLQAAERCGFPTERIIFEFSETEKVADVARFRDVVRDYTQHGFRTAIDDFGSGHSGLNLLAEVPADIVKIDMALIRGIHQDRKRQIIVRNIVQLVRDLDLLVVAEGLETEDEVRAVLDLGVTLCQGFYFARPAFRSLASVPLEGLSTKPASASVSNYRNA